MTPRLQKIMEEWNRDAIRIALKNTNGAIGDLIYQGLSSYCGANHEDFCVKVINHFVANIKAIAVTERDKELLESAPEFDEHGMRLKIAAYLDCDSKCGEVEDGLIGARIQFDQLKLKLAARDEAIDFHKYMGQGYAEKCGSLRSEVVYLQKELASLREELAPLKQIPRVSESHYRSELKIHQAESEQFVKEATTKLQAQDALLREALHYIKNHRWFDEDDEFYQKLTAHFWVRGSK